MHSSTNPYFTARVKKTPCEVQGVFRMECLTMTYFHGRAAHYHRRKSVSRSCSGWEGVVPLRYGRQTKLVDRLPCLEGLATRPVWQ